MRRGFTLLELLIVITIIVIVSAVALPTILPALAHRQVSEAARILQAALVGARDAAIRDNAPTGIRLLPDPIFNGSQPALLASGAPNPSPFAGRLDPTLPLAYNRIVPIETAPEYQEGLVSTVSSTATFFGGASTALPYPVGTGVNYPSNVLIATEAVLNGAVLNPPTNWFWNIRVGDKIQINKSGIWYTVVGPMNVPPQGTVVGNVLAANPEMFVNVGLPGTPSTLPNAAEFLFLVNGVDDNQDGWIDSGWDGVDNNGNQVVDELAEWTEVEAWQGSLLNTPATGVAYTIRRRPMPVTNAREMSLPSDVVIDASSWGAATFWGGQPERSRVPGSAFNIYTGVIDVLVNPDGSIVPTTVYSSPSSMQMNAAFFHFWLAERGDIYGPTVANGAPALASGFNFTLPMPPDAISLSQSAPFGTPTKDAYATLMTQLPLPVLKGESRIVTLFTRSGQISTNDNPTFNVLNVSQPFFEAQRGTVSQ
jgi:prepilin-type N-terminal cleavage/methylation domain-containing protein